MDRIRRRIQSALDRFMDLGPLSHLGGGKIPKGKIGAYCPECWKPYRSAVWIAKRRVQRHAKRIHGMRLALKAVPTERKTPLRIRKPRPAKTDVDLAKLPDPTAEA